MSKSKRAGVILFEGPLEQRSVWNSTWRTFRYVLEGSTLCAFSKSKRSGKAKEVFQLGEHKFSDCGHDTFSLTSLDSGSEPLFFRAVTKAERAIWVRALESICQPNPQNWADGHSVGESISDPCLVVWLGAAGTRVQAANTAFLTTFGYESRAALKGVHLDSLVDKEPKLYGQPVGCEAKLRVKTGEGAWRNCELVLGGIPEKEQLFGLLRIKPVGNEEPTPNEELPTTSTNQQAQPPAATTQQQEQAQSTQLSAANLESRSTRSMPTGRSNPDEQLDLLFSRAAKEVGEVVYQAMRDSLEVRWSELLCTIDGLRSEKRRDVGRSRSRAASTSSSLMSSSSIISSASSSMMSSSTSSSLSSSSSLTSMRDIRVDTNRTEVGPMIYESGTGTCVRSACVDGWQCVLKELQFGWLAEKTIDRFESELATLESLPRHDNLVQYLFHRRTPTHVQIFMTRYDTTLARYLDDRMQCRQAFTNVEIVKFLVDIMRGVEVLHHNGIVHRDLKPDNIFISFDRDNFAGRLIVGDFDSAKDLRAQGQAQSFVGTLAYMAPEVFNQQAYGIACDIWSVGMMLYELLTFQPLLVRGPWQSQELQIDRDVFPEDASPLIDIFDECHQMSPHLRPTAASVLRRLQRCNFTTEGLLQLPAEPPPSSRSAVADLGLASMSMPSFAGDLLSPMSSLASGSMPHLVPPVVDHLYPYRPHFQPPPSQQQQQRHHQQQQPLLQQQQQSPEQEQQLAVKDHSKTPAMASESGQFLLVPSIRRMMANRNPIGKEDVEVIGDLAKSSPSTSSTSSMSLSRSDGTEGNDWEAQLQLQKKKKEWRRVEELGRGSFGIVYLVQHQKTGQWAAMKKMQASNTRHKRVSRTKAMQWADAPATQELPLEAELLKGLDHPGIVKLYDCFEVDRQWHLITEFVEGGDLIDRIEEYDEERLPEETAQRWFREMIEALRYCHDRGVVHRDLKVENILIDKNDHVRITDFGLGNTFGKDTFLRTLCGSAKYSPPELFARMAYRGPPLDIWATGVILFVMLTGEFPWSADEDGSPSLQVEVTSCQFAIPDFISTHPRQLIRSILVVCPEDRPTATDILAHPWFTKTKV